MPTAKKQLIYKRHRLKYQFGLTLEDYAAMIAQQSGLCAICRTPAKLEVDHNHTTGVVRALLCGHCNKGLGLFRENPLVLEAAAEYARKYAGEDNN